MIRQWGAVLMAAAGLTMGVGAGAPAANATTRPAGAVRQNQTITFARSPERGGDAIRATARGPVDGFGTARVLSFAADERTGRFHGVWELTFPAGSVRYAFAGAARQPANSAELLAAPTSLALPSSTAAATAAPGSALAVRPVAARALVAGDFLLGGGTGRFADVTGHGSFRGWTMVQPAELSA
jgi:hypothetical protein